jgi:ACS family D-galactonate transporter-like MFS transporter
MERDKMNSHGNDGPALPRRSGVRWRIFFLLLLLVSINYVDRASLLVALPVISAEFKLSAAQQGFLLSAFFWTYCAMQIPGGLLADWLKPRIVIAGAAMIWGLFQCLGASATSTAMLAFSRLGLGAAEGPVYPSASKLNAVWMPIKERGRGAALLDGGAPLGAAFWSVIIAALISALGSWRLAFLIAGLGTIACGAFAWWYIRDMPQAHPRVNELERAYIIEGQRDDHSTRSDQPVTNKEIFTNASIWLLFVGWICCNTMWVGLLSWMPSYLANTQKLEISAVGGFSFIIFLSGFVGEIVGGSVLDLLIRRNVRRGVACRMVFGTSAIIATTALFAVAHLHDITTIVAVLAVALFFTRWSNLYWAVPTMLVDSEKVGLVGGTMNFGATAFNAITTILIGLIIKETGSYSYALTFFAISGVLLLICSLCIRYRRVDCNGNTAIEAKLDSKFSS